MTERMEPVEAAVQPACRGRSPINRRLRGMFAGLLARRDRQVLLAGLLLVGATRASHLRGPIDNPHPFRQCDTAHYAYAFHREGIRLLHPSVCWMGPHKTVIYEFPLPQAAMAVAYNLFGYRHAYGRLVILLCFCGSAVYLFGMLRKLTAAPVARWAALVYLVLPLAQFYSRSFHVDFCALLFGYGMAYHLMEAVEGGRMRHYAAGTLCAAGGLLVKAPSVFYLGLPLGVWMLMQGQTRRALCAAGLMVLPAAAFLAFRRHVTAVNGAMPDWSFLPGYHVMDDMRHWYFGTLAMRGDAGMWATLAHRALWDAAAPAGLVLLGAGLLAMRHTAWAAGTAAGTFVGLWGAGLLVYVLVFFSLNVYHDYYQLPFLAWIALVCGVGLEGIRRAAARLGLGERTAPIAAALAFGALLWNSTALAESRYYWVDRVREEAGAIIRSHTPEDSLVLTAARWSLPTDPQLLYRARRYGWSVCSRRLNRQAVRGVRALGADYLAVLAEHDDHSGYDRLAGSGTPRVFRLVSNPRRWLFLYALQDNGDCPSEEPAEGANP